MKKILSIWLIFLMISTGFMGIMLTEIENAEAEDIGAWQVTTGLPAIRVNPCAVEWNGTMYVTGGTDGLSGTNTVYRGDVNGDGTIPAWATYTMDCYKENHASIAWNDRLYVLGGNNDWGSTTSSVYFASINGDGTLGTWSSTTDLPGNRYGLSAAVYNGYIYASGGTSFISPLDSLYIGQINADGTISSWSSSTIPAPLADHSTIAYNGWFYLIGGVDDMLTVYDTIYKAPINPDGSLGGWTLESNMPQGRLNHDSAMFNNQMYIIGGDDGDSTFSTVYNATINPDGTLGQWSTTTPLPAPRKGLATLAYNWNLYAIGGSDNADTITNTVYFSALPQPPPTVTVTYPTGPGIIEGGTIDITWDATDTPTPNENILIDIYYSDNGGDIWNLIASPANPASGSGTYSWDTVAAGVPEGVNYLIRVNATDDCPTPKTSSDESDNPFSIDNTIDDQWFLQIQTDESGFKNLSMEPVELSANEIITPITNAGDFLLGSWMTANYTSAQDLAGSWTFNVSGYLTTTDGGGFLYAKIYTSSDMVTPLFTTIIDDENVTAFAGSYHAFEWSDTVTGTHTAGDSIYVEIWLSATFGQLVANTYDVADGETSIEGDIGATSYLNTQASDNVYEEVTEVVSSGLQIPINDDVEGGNIGWTTQTTSPDSWAIRSISAHSPTNSWNAGNGAYGSNWDEKLTSPSFTIPADATSATWTWWHAYEMEADYDGGVVEINPGTGWERLIPAGGYDFMLWDGVLVGQDAFSGSQGWVLETCNILAYAGNTCQVRYWMSSDGSVEETGWNIDDIVITIDGLSNSALEHIWTVPITGGTDVEVGVEAYHTANAESDDFAFYYSTTGAGTVGDAGWTQIFTVIKTSDDNVPQTYSDATLDGFSGTLYIGAIDTDRTMGNTATDTLYVDHLYVRSETSGPSFVLGYDYGMTQSSVKPVLVGIESVWCNITLVAGWNLVSIPQEMTSTDILDVLASIDGQWDVVKYYDATNASDLWKTYRAGSTVNDLWNIDHTMGFWLHATVACDLNINGVLPASTDITLLAGWNLVSYPTLTSSLASDALTGTNTDMISIYNGAMPYLIEDRTDLSAITMSAGNGYWVHVTADCTWSIDW